MQTSYCGDISQIELQSNQDLPSGDCIGYCSDYGVCVDVRTRDMKFIHTEDLHLDSLLRGMSTFFDAPDDAIRSIFKSHATN